MSPKKALISTLTKATTSLSMNTNSQNTDKEVQETSLKEEETPDHQEDTTTDLQEDLTTDHQEEKE